MGDFNQAVAFTLAKTIEGGFVDNPRDPGGATNMGVTQRTFNHWRTTRGELQDTVRNLTQDEALEIYRAWYWTNNQCDVMPAKIAVAVFDWDVNSGNGAWTHEGAIEELQKILGVPNDGIVGQHTIQVLLTANADSVLENYLQARIAFYNGMPQAQKDEFLHGWLDRVAALRTYLTSLDIGSSDGTAIGASQAT